MGVRHAQGRKRNPWTRCEWVGLETYTGGEDAKMEFQSQVGGRGIPLNYRANNSPGVVVYPRRGHPVDPAGTGELTGRGLEKTTGYTGCGGVLLGSAQGQGPTRGWHSKHSSTKQSGILNEMDACIWIYWTQWIYFSETAAIRGKDAHLPTERMEEAKHALHAVAIIYTNYSIEAIWDSSMQQDNLGL